MCVCVILQVLDALRFATSRNALRTVSVTSFLEAALASGNRTLFLNTSALSLQISGLVSDNTKALKPALDQLKGVLDILEKNLDNIDRGLALLGPFYRVFANTLGNGRWFDTYIQNLSAGGLLGLTTGIGQ